MYRAALGLFLLMAGTATAGESRQAYFGDLHLHTGGSFDAALLYGVRTTPDQAYRFARGEPVTLDGRPVRRAWPLDFLAVTDHAEYLGVFAPRPDGGALLYRLVEKISAGAKPSAAEAVATTNAWRRQVAAADANNRPGWFTALVGFEWSPMQGDKAQHRNVIFRDRAADRPHSALDSREPEDLWSYLETQQRRGIAALAITNHPNSSGGLAFSVPDKGMPHWAVRRAANEPLSEIITAGGQAETHPELSPKDPFAAFAIKDGLLTGEGRSDPHGGTVREGLGRGLAIAAGRSPNPFQFGVVGSSDFHNGLSTSDEAAYRGGIGGIDPATDPDVPAGAALNLLSGSGNLTGVWAEANTREAIFDALRRRESFATSGTRIRVRLLAGWDRDGEPPAAWDDGGAWGVPMGGELRPPPDEGARPRLLLWAARAPDGVPLERLQLVKLEAHGGTTREHVIDIAVEPGAAELRVLWDDAGFDPSAPTAYYLRVLEMPTPRWSTLAARKAGLPVPVEVAATIQERAWSSPVWYSPR